MLSSSKCAALALFQAQKLDGKLHRS